MIHYIIQVLIFQTLFLAVYDLFLKKETFFQWNRAYLIITSLLAYAIPFIKLESASNFAQKNITALPEIFLNPEMIFLNEVNLSQEKTNWFALENFYYLGIAIALLLFIYKITLIASKIYRNTIIKQKEYNLVILPKQKSAFSFFKYLFLGKSIFESDHQHIIEHELTHIKERHSVDLLFFELQKIVLWFNPFSYLFQHRISALHEFIADQNTIKQEDKTSFFEGLLQQTFQVEKFAFINQYKKKSLLKKRIIMATKNKSKEILKLKYLLVVPIIMLMLVYTSCENKENNNVYNEQVYNKVEIEDSVPFSAIDKVPVYKGCEGNQQELKKCMSNKIAKHVSENFNVDLAQNLGLEAGKKRISVQFQIDKNGHIADVKARAPHPKLQKEAIRIIKLLPKMKPGLQRNKAVNVRYNLPIIFKVEGDESVEMINGLIKNIILDKKNLENTIIESRNSDKFNEVISFKLKIPGKPTLSINGNKLNEEAIKNLKQSKAGDIMIVFDVKVKNSKVKTSFLSFSIK